MKSLGKSLGKAFKHVGLGAAVVGGAAGLVYLSNPEALVPLVAAAGPWGPVLAIAVQLSASIALDQLKHRQKAMEAEEK